MGFQAFTGVVRELLETPNLRDGEGYGKAPETDAHKPARMRTN